MASTQKLRAARAPRANHPLTLYRSLRNFDATTEPLGGSPGAARDHKDHPFVVQKHAARRLHYDFRLGLNGVLKSWAVTKGPSYNPRAPSGSQFRLRITHGSISISKEPFPRASTARVR